MRFKLRLCPSILHSCSFDILFGTSNNYTYNNIWDLVSTSTIQYPHHLCGVSYGLVLGFGIIENSNNVIHIYVIIIVLVFDEVVFIQDMQSLLIFNLNI